MGDQSDDRPGPSRATLKRSAILAAATEVFLEAGFLGASMDEIAAKAGVSKQTVYKHFADKEGLFGEVVSSSVDEIGDPVREEVLRLAASEDVEGDLRRLARRQLGSVMQPQLLRLRRVVIAESVRFPELGRAFYERGPRRTIEALAGAFTDLAARGALDVEDPKLAAEQFNWLVMAASVNRAMLLGEDAPPSRAELNRRADSGVRAFLRAHRGSGQARRAASS